MSRTYPYHHEVMLAAYDMAEAFRRYHEDPYGFDRQSKRFNRLLTEMVEGYEADIQRLRKESIR